MGQITVKLEGADSLISKFKAYATGSSKRVQNVVAENLLIIESDAKQNAPVDTGLLRSSISAQTTGKFAGNVTVNVNYASYVENGTSKMPGRFYLYRAYHANKQKFLSELKEALKFRI